MSFLSDLCLLSQDETSYRIIMLHAHLDIQTRSSFNMINFNIKLYLNNNAEFFEKFRIFLLYLSNRLQYLVNTNTVNTYNWITRTNIYAKSGSYNVFPIYISSVNTYTR